MFQVVSRAVALTLAAAVMLSLPLPAFAQDARSGSILDRHAETSRGQSAGAPRSEDDQALVANWPLYRTPRGQTVFNAAMATLKATKGRAPDPDVFARCPDLACAPELPKISSSGWLPAGRLWVARDAYVLIVVSPRDDGFSRHGRGSMQYFVFHEFHNSTRNTDLYDTISSHSGSVFVPFYLGKQGIDAEGFKYVVIVQAAPFDVVSIHASNYGSAGPGVEVAKNSSEPLEPLQLSAGILLAAMVVAAAPNLEVVNHRGSEGRPMLEGYDAWRQRWSRTGQRVTLPFVAAAKPAIENATAQNIAELIHRADMGPPPRIAVRDRGFLTPDMRQSMRVAATDAPRLVSPMVPAPRPARRPE